MKKSLFILLILILFAAFVVQACAPAEEIPSDDTSAPAAPLVADVQPTTTSVAAVYLNSDFPDAASIRNQLAFGTLKLEGTPNAVTPEQAKTLLPLWQALLNLTGNDTVAEAEISALQNQISETMSAEQMQAIASMQITNAALNAFYAEHGIVMPTPIPGVTKVPNSQLSQAEREAARATAQALGTPVGTGAGGATGQASRTLLFEKVIEYLTEVGGS